MEKKAFYKREDAMSYANELANEVGGYVAPREVARNTDEFETPREIDQWSGEISAFRVLNSGYDTIAYIGYWE